MGKIYNDVNECIIFQQAEQKVDLRLAKLKVG